MKGLLMRDDYESKVALQWAVQEGGRKLVVIGVRLEPFEPKRVPWV